MLFIEIEKRCTNRVNDLYEIIYNGRWEILDARS